MKKNFFIVITILIILFLINFCRNYFILKKIYNLGSKFETTENYRVQEKITTLNNKVVKNYYYMDKKYLYIEETQIQDKNYNYIIFHNLDTDEYSKFVANENGELILTDNQIKDSKRDFIESFIYYKFYEFSDLLKKSIFKIIKEDSENYIINVNNQDEYIDKQTGLLRKIVSISNDIDVEVIFEKNVVDSKTIDINQYLIKSELT